MKTKLLLWISLFIISNCLAAQNLTQVSVDKTNAVLEKVIEAYGGAERINKLETMSIQFDNINYAVNQSRNPGPPWDESKSSGSTHIDLAQQLFVTNNKSDSPDQDFNNSIILNSDQSYQINWLNNTATPIAEPNFLNTAGPFIRVTPVMLVKQLMQRSQTSHYLGQVNVDGQQHDVISLVMEVGPAISLYFDQKTHLLTRSERYIPVFGLIGYRFLNYTNIEGIPFNQQFELVINDDISNKRSNHGVKINPVITEMVKLNAELTINTAQQQPQGFPLERQKIEDGVYLIGGTGTYALFIEMEDHVIAVGGTAGIPERINLLKEVVPNKPIKYGVMTHHHSDHIVGAQAYADQKIAVITSDAHAATVRASTNTPDMEMIKVNKKKTFKDKKQTVELIDIGPTAHTEHLLVAYLPKEGIVFEADHFGIFSPGNITAADQSTQDFAKALKKHKIKANKIISAHTPIVASQKELDQAISLAQSAQASTD